MNAHWKAKQKHIVLMWNTDLENMMTQTFLNFLYVFE